MDEVDRMMELGSADLSRHVSTVFGSFWIVLACVGLFLTSWARFRQPIGGDRDPGCHATASDSSLLWDVQGPAKPAGGRPQPLHRRVPIFTPSGLIPPGVHHVFIMFSSSYEASETDPCQVLVRHDPAVRAGAGGSLSGPPLRPSTSSSLAAPCAPRSGWTARTVRRTPCPPRSRTSSWTPGRPTG